MVHELYAEADVKIGKLVWGCELAGLDDAEIPKKVLLRMSTKQEELEG